MENIRAVIKMLLVVASTVFFYILIMLSVLLSIAGLNHERYRAYFLSKWGLVCCKIMSIDIQVENVAPKPPFMMVSNHLSYLDVFVLFSQLRCLFVAKSDVKTWPMIGFIVKTCGILFIDRNKRKDVTRVNRLIKNNINQYQGIILFAEGTTSPGLNILPFKSSLLQHPADDNMPVHYCSISYSTSDQDAPAYEKMAWWGDASFFTHLFEFLKLKKSVAYLNFGEEPIKSFDRKELTEKLNAAVSNSFKPMVKESEFLEKHENFVSPIH